MDKLELAAVGFIKPVIDILEVSGMSVDELLRKTNLNKYDLNDPYGYVPLNSVHVFLDKLKQELGGDNFPVLFRDKIHLVNAGTVGDNVLACPDLLAAVNYGINYDHLLLSNERMGLNINGEVATIRQWYTDKPVPGRSEIELLSFCLLVDAIRVAAGDDWSPLAIQIQGPEITGFDTLVSLSNDTKVEFNQPFTSVSFSTELLSASILDDVTQVNNEPDFLPGNNLSDQLQCLLDSSNRILDLGRASELLCISPRTLKRYLKNEDTSYSEIVDQWRFKKSLKLLNDPHCTINEISQLLHYSNTPNFIRAFTRWTGITPMRYREKLDKVSL